MTSQTWGGMSLLRSSFFCHSSTYLSRGYRKLWEMYVSDWRKLTYMTSGATPPAIAMRGPESIAPMPCTTRPSKGSSSTSGCWARKASAMARVAF